MRETQKGERNSGRERDREFTIFVDNLPQRLDRYGLKGIFQRAGSVSDTYIPLRRGRQSKRRFGFVRFRNQADARKGILLFNNHIIRGNRITVTEARYGKGMQSRVRREDVARNTSLRDRNEWRLNHTDQEQEKRGSHRRENSNWRWIPKQSTSGEGEARMSQESQDKILKVVKCEVKEGNLHWLRKTLVCESNHPKEVCSVQMAVNLESAVPITVRDMGSYKFLLTFNSEEDLEKTLVEGKEWLEVWFEKVRRWREDDVSDTRRVWIKVSGIPAQVWHVENFQVIAHLWGEFVCVDAQTEDMTSLQSARILLDTSRMSIIDEEILMDTGDCGYRLKVTEIPFGSPLSHAVFASKEPIVFASLVNPDANESRKEGETSHGSMEVVQETFLQQNEGLGNDEPEYQDQSRTITEVIEKGREHLFVSGNGATQPPHKGDPVSEGMVSTSLNEVRINQDENFIEGRNGEIEALIGDRSGALNTIATPQSGHDSEATIDENYLHTPKRIDNVSGECQYNSILEDFEESRKSQKSKKKKAKRLREKCRSIQKEVNVGREFIKESEHVWEVTKALGIASKNSDAEAVEVIARNMAAKATQKQIQNQS